MTATMTRYFGGPIQICRIIQSRPGARRPPHGLDSAGPPSADRWGSLGIGHMVRMRSRRATEVGSSGFAA